MMILELLATKENAGENIIFSPKMGVGKGHIGCLKRKANSRGKTRQKNSQKS